MPEHSGTRFVVGLAVIVVLFAGLHLISILGILDGQGAACSDRKRTWDAIHGVIVEQTKPAKPSPVVLKAFPELKPFYTDGTPEFAEAQRLAHERRDALLAVLGPRPSC